jgi:hypothetical protein
MRTAAFRPTADQIEAALVQHRSIAAAADALGLAPRMLRQWMAQDGIPTPAMRGWPKVSRVTGRYVGRHSKPGADQETRQAPLAVTVDRDSAFADLSHALVLTGGRWRDLAALADKHGMTVRQMQLRWFQLRMPVQKAKAQ